MKGPCLHTIDADLFGKGAGSVLCKRDEQDLLRFHLVPINDVLYLSDDGGGFSRSRPGDDEVVVFIGDGGGALLEIQCAAFDVGEEVVVGLEFILDELLIVFTSQVLGIHAKGAKVLDGIDLLGLKKRILAEAACS